MKALRLTFLVIGFLSVFLVNCSQTPEAGGEVSPVAPETTPEPASTAQPMPTATVVPTATAVVAVPDEQLIACLTALTLISGWHEHQASVEVSVNIPFQTYYELYGYGYADVKAPEFTAEAPSNIVAKNIVQSVTQPYDLLDRYCFDVIDIELLNALNKEIQIPRQ